MKDVLYFDRLMSEVDTMERARLIDRLLSDFLYVYVGKDQKMKDAAVNFIQLVKSEIADAVLECSSEKKPVGCGEDIIAKTIKKMMERLNVEEITDIQVNKKLSDAVKREGIVLRQMQNTPDNSVERAYEIARYNYARAQTARVLISTVIDLVLRRRYGRENVKLEASGFELADMFFNQEVRFMKDALMFGCLLGKTEVVKWALKQTCYTEDNSVNWVIMHYLELGGEMPSSYYRNDESAFKKDIAKRLKQLCVNE